MMLIHPVKEFYVKAVKHAKQIKLKQLNEIEADIMIFEHQIFTMMDNGASEEKLSPVLDKITDMKQHILNKKKQII